MGWHTREELRLDAQKRAKQKKADERLIANLPILKLKLKADLKAKKKVERCARSMEEASFKEAARCARAKEVAKQQRILLKSSLSRERGPLSLSRERGPRERCPRERYPRGRGFQRQRPEWTASAIDEEFVEPATAVASSIHSESAPGTPMASTIGDSQASLF